MLPVCPQDILKAGIVPHALELLDSDNGATVAASLSALRAMALKDCDTSNALIDAGTLDKVVALLQASKDKARGWWEGWG